MKAHIKAMLDFLGVREFLWDSIIYRLYLRSANRKAYDESTLQREFYHNLLTECDIDGDLWFDIGANIGSKTALFRHCCRKVVAVEPDPANYEVLQRRFALRPGVNLEQVAVGSQAGIANLHRPNGKEFSAYSTLSSKQLECLKNDRRYNLQDKLVYDDVWEVSVITLDDLVKSYGKPSYIKIDVEGYEIRILEGLTQSIPCISFEANLPDFEEETISCLERYNALTNQAEFNFSVTEPPIAFEREAWLSLNEIKTIVLDSGHKYMELFCRKGK